MPKLSKKARLEWSYFIGANGRRQYNALCRKCSRGCKQSFRVVVVDCPEFCGKGEGQPKNVAKWCGF